MIQIQIFATVTTLVGLVAEPSQADSHATAPDFPCLNPPSLSADIPHDSPITDQNSLNCFAWSEFIAVNWAAEGTAQPADPSDPVANFGQPGDPRPTVWETYADIHNVFLPGGVAPLPFGQRPPLPPACAAYEGQGLRSLARSAKVSVEFQVPSDISEAFPFNGSPNWLADRYGNQVFYEILINEDEYNYFVQNHLYNAEIGYLKTAGGQQVDLPKGAIGGALGAMEFKAAWVTMAQGDHDWSTYKQSTAVIYDAAHDSCEVADVALVGLHIIHKTESQPQWIWATFEHQDNAPDLRDAQAGTAGDGFLFYNPSCTAQTIPAQCVGNSVLNPDGSTFCDATLVGSPSMTSCQPNTSPGFCITPACPAMSVQVARQNPIADGQDNLVASLNQAAHQMIAQTAPDSVFLNYMLVDVLWSDSPVDQNTATLPPPLAPLSISGMRPAPTERPIVNTTMETYIQSTTCIECHQGAKLAWPEADGSLTPFASDYSFVLKSALPLPPSQ